MRIRDGPATVTEERLPCCAATAEPGWKVAERARMGSTRCDPGVRTLQAGGAPGRGAPDLSPSGGTTQEVQHVTLRYPAAERPATMADSP